MLPEWKKVKYEMDIKELAAFFLGLGCGMMAEVALVIILQLYEFIEQKIYERKGKRNENNSNE